MADHEFGVTTASGNYDSVSANFTFIGLQDVIFTCPGDGLFDVVGLHLFGKGGSDPWGNIRVAIFAASDRALMAEGNAQVSVNSTTAGWFGHTAAGITQSHQLTGGVAYILAVSRDANDTYMRYYFGDSGDGNYKSSADYTAGYPDPLPAFTEAGTIIPNIRCQINHAAAGGLSIPVAMHHYMRNIGSR